MIHLNTKVFRTTTACLVAQKGHCIQQGGTNSGKTFGIILALVLWAANINFERRLVTICAVNFPYVRKDTLRAFKDIVAELGIKLNSKSESTYTYKINTTTFEFVGMEDAKKASHGKRDVLYINEAYLVPYMVYKNLAIRTNYTTILDYNPHEDYWLQEQVIPTLEYGTYSFVRTTYLDNPAVSSKVVKEIELLKISNPNLYRVYGLGLTGKIEGLVFPNVTIVDSMPPSDQIKRYVYCMDFGYANDPTTLYKLALSRGELFIHEYVYEKGLLNDDIIALLFANGINTSDLIVADSEDPKSIAEIKKKGGFNIEPAIKGKDSVIHGINTINQYKINIVKSSTNLLKEQKNYRYKYDQKLGKYLNEPIDLYNHGWDSVRYGGQRILTPKALFTRKVYTS